MGTRKRSNQPTADARYKATGKKNLQPAGIVTIFLSVRFSGHFPRWTWVSQYQNVSVWILLELRMREVVAYNWSYNTCKAPVKSSPSTNQHTDCYRTDALPVAQPTVSGH